MKKVGKLWCQGLFYNKFAGPGLQLYQKRYSSTGVFLWILWNSQACYCIKKGILTQVFSCEFYEICKNTFLTERLRATASGVTSNNRFPFNNCIYYLSAKGKISYIFLLAIICYRKDKVYFKVGIFFLLRCFFFSCNFFLYNFSVLIRCCVHISIVGLNSLNWIESYRHISLRRA